jgi:hypothetical protein
VGRATRGEERDGGVGNTRGASGRGQCGSDSSKGEARRGGGMAAPGAHTVFLISSIIIYMNDEAI